MIFTGSSLKIQNGKGAVQYWAAITATLTIVASGMHYAWTSPSLEKLQHETSPFTVTSDEGSWIAVMPLLGAFIGGVIVVLTVDILGRKTVILLSTFPFFASWIMIAYSKSVILLYIARFIAGIADGWVFTAVPMYIGEIADPKIRGFLGSGVAVLWIFGMLLINILGSYLSITTTALVSSLVPLVSLVTFYWMPESSYYLMMRGKQEEAKQSLHILRGLQDIDTELDRIKNAIKSQFANTGKFFDLFTVKSNRRAIFVIFMIRTVQQLSGTTAIMFYTQTIFKEAGNSVSYEVGAMIYVSVQLVMALFSSGIVDRAGRKPLLIISTIGSAIALFIEGTYFYLKTNTDLDVTKFSIIPVIALIGFDTAFSIGLQTIPLLMLGELFPTNVKAFALALADAYFALTATIVAKFFQIMNDNFGMFVSFYIFSTCCIIGLIAIIFIVPETKGKTLEEIQEYFKGEAVNNSTVKTDIEGSVA